MAKLLRPLPRTPMLLALGNENSEPAIASLEEIDMIGIMLPGGILGGNGMLVIDARVTMRGDDAKTVRLKLGGEVLAELTSSGGYEGRLGCSIQARDGLPLKVTLGGLVKYLAINTKADQPLVVTGQLTVIADNSVNHDWWRVDLLPGTPPSRGFPTQPDHPANPLP
jgi:hypothetical protein